jgi:hypothetical protein
VLHALTPSDVIVTMPPVSLAPRTVTLLVPPLIVSEPARATLIVNAPLKTLFGSIITIDGVVAYPLAAGRVNTRDAVKVVVKLIIFDPDVIVASASPTF